MGYWWKDVPTIPEDHGLGVIIKGNPNAWSKKQAPLLWRIQQRFVIIRVNHETPFELYFDDGERKMIFHKPIEEKYFAARIGPRDIKFVAVDKVLEIPFEMKRIDSQFWSYGEIHMVQQENTFLRAWGYPRRGEYKIV